jgi:hypothetical protein
MKITVNNDFHQPRAIFELLDGLTVENMDVPLPPQAKLLVEANGQATNGTH